MTERPLEVCGHCGRLIKRTGSREVFGRDPATGVVAWHPGNAGWVHSLTGDAVCRGVEHPDPPWLLCAVPRQPGAARIEPVRRTTGKDIP